MKRKLRPGYTLHGTDAIIKTKSTIASVVTGCLMPESVRNRPLSKKYVPYAAAAATRGNCTVARIGNRSCTRHVVTSTTPARLTSRTSHPDVRSVPAVVAGAGPAGHEPCQNPGGGAVTSRSGAIDRTLPLGVRVPRPDPPPPQRHDAAREPLTHVASLRQAGCLRRATRVEV